MPNERRLPAKRWEAMPLPDPGFFPVPPGIRWRFVAVLATLAATAVFVAASVWLLVTVAGDL